MNYYLLWAQQEYEKVPVVIADPVKWTDEDYWNQQRKNFQEVYKRFRAGRGYASENVEMFAEVLKHDGLLIKQGFETPVYGVGAPDVQVNSILVKRFPTVAEFLITNLAAGVTEIYRKQ